MITFPEIRHHYQQAVESVVIEKSTQVITAIAFHTFHTLKYAALVPAAINSVVIGLPIAIVNVSLFGIAYGIEFVSRNISTFENLDSIPGSTLQQVVLAIDSIAKYIVPKIVYFLTIIALAPFIVVTKGINFIEDVSIEITQIALDILGIPVKLHISRKKLVSILNEWKSAATPGENRRKACDQILDCYDRSNELFHNLFSFPIYLYIDECGLRSLPEIFEYKPFSKLDTLSLSNNQLTYLPNDIFNLPNHCHLYISQNQFSEEEVFRILRTTNQPNYHGPVVAGIHIYDTPESPPLLLGRRAPRYNATHREENRMPRTIDQFYTDLCQTIGREPQNLSNLERSEALRSWLSRLSRVSDYSAEDETIRRAFITNIILYLEEANRNREFQNIFNHTIHGASATCGDRVALSVLHLDIAYQLANIDIRNMRHLSEFLLRGCFTMELLEECALQKTQSMRGEVDELEVYLGYPIALKRELNLPISQETMLYFRCSLLTTEDLATARDFVMSHLNDRDACLTFLAKHDTWKRALASYNQGAFDAIERKKRQDQENAESPEESIHIENEYIQALKALSAQWVTSPS